MTSSSASGQQRQSAGNQEGSTAATAFKISHDYKTKAKASGPSSNNLLFRPSSQQRAKREREVPDFKESILQPSSCCSNHSQWIPAQRRLHMRCERSSSLPLDQQIVKSIEDCKDQVVDHILELSKTLLLCAEVLFRFLDVVKLFIDQMPFFTNQA